MGRWVDNVRAQANHHECHAEVHCCAFMLMAWVGGLVHGEMVRWVGGRVTAHPLKLIIMSATLRCAAVPLCS